MRSFRSLVEQQIARARASGKLERLQGEGKPLPDRPIETSEQAAMSTGMRIMAEAGVIPEEFSLKKQLDAARKAYNAAASDQDRQQIMRQIADLELRFGIAQDARRKFMS